MDINQVSVFLENRAGQLHMVTDILSRNQIDIRALNIAETADYGIVRLITADPWNTLKILKDNDLIATLTPVFAVGVPNRPGGLADLLKLMADNNVDVEYMYSVFGQPNGLAYMIFRVKDPENVVEMLTTNGIKVADANELGVN